MAEPLKIEIYRNKTIDELTKLIATPNEKINTGSAAAATAAVSAALLARAAAVVQEEDMNADHDKLDWYVRNTEILRTYMIRLVDEDVKCHGPLRRALREGDPRNIEAARQAAVSICLEIINMMGKCLEMAEELLEFASETAKHYIAESSDLAYSSSLASGRYVLYLCSLSSDDTYRYIIRRENELTMIQQKEVYQRILQAAYEP